MTLRKTLLTLAALVVATVICAATATLSAALPMIAAGVVGVAGGQLIG